MNNLSERLQKIAMLIKKGESVADIGTDHAYLPLYLYEHGISSKLILTDINPGPLEIARKNLGGKVESFDIRLGNGLEPLENGEVDTVIIAGMGGFTIIDILAADIKKTKSFKKIILQPRMASPELRKWLKENDIPIMSETLTRENGKITELLQVDNSLITHPDYKEDINYEISPLHMDEPLLKEWVERKIATEQEIIDNINENSKKDNSKIVEKSIGRIKVLEDILSKINGRGDNDVNK